MMPHLDALLSVCGTLLADPTSALRVAAMAALVALCPFVVDDAKVASFQALVPRLFQVL